jgi:hypothetical protein
MSRKSKFVREPYRKVGTANEHDLTTDGENYILNVPEFKAFDYYGKCKKNNEELYKKISDYAKEEGLVVNRDNMPTDISAEKYIELIKRAKIELGQGWGINEKIWIINKVDPILAPYVNVRPAKGSGFNKPREKKEKSGKKEEKAKTIEELKPGEEIEIDESEEIFGRMLPPVTQYVQRKKEPTMTRKEFSESIKDEKERHYKEFLEAYYKYGVDLLGTSNSAIASSKPYGPAAEAEYYVFKDKDQAAWNKIVKKEPLLKEHKKLIKNPKRYFEQFYYQESEREPSEGFLSSEGEKESEYEDDSSEYAYDSDNWHGLAEGDPYSDLEEEEEIIEKMPALTLAPEPASAPAPATAPPQAPTGSITRTEFEIRKDFYEKSKGLTQALKDAGWKLVLSKSKQKHYYHNTKTGVSTFQKPTSGGKKTRKKRGKRTKKSKMKKTKKNKHTTKKRTPKKKNYTRKK